LKRRETQRQIEQREDAEMRRRNAESDRLFLLYEQEKERQRIQDIQKLSEFHLKQIVSCILLKTNQRFLKAYI
jgi:hypothetical protein